MEDQNGQIIAGENQRSNARKKHTHAGPVGKYPGGNRRVAGLSAPVERARYERVEAKPPRSSSRPPCAAEQRRPCRDEPSRRLADRELLLRSLAQMHPRHAQPRLQSRSPAQLQLIAGVSSNRPRSSRCLQRTDPGALGPTPPSPFGICGSIHDRPANRPIPASSRKFRRPSGDEPIGSRPGLRPDARSSGSRPHVPCVRRTTVRQAVSGTRTPRSRDPFPPACTSSRAAAPTAVARRPGVPRR